MKKYLLIALIVYNILPLQGQAINIHTDHQSVITFAGNYQIFPKDRINNAIYKQSEYFFSENNYSIITGEVVAEGILLFLRDDQQEIKMVYLNDKQQHQFEDIGNGFAILTIDNRRKLYRVNAEDIVEELLPGLRSGGGLVYNTQKTAAFYHINNIQTDKQKKMYFFRIHILPFKDTVKKTISINIADTVPYIQLRWKTNQVLQYKLSGNRVKEINVR